MPIHSHAASEGDWMRVETLGRAYGWRLLRSTIREAVRRLLGRRAHQGSWRTLIGR